MTKKIIQRKNIFIGVEGDSEQSFIKWLQVLSDEKKLFIHLNCVVLNGGGYKTMLKKMRQERSKRKDRQNAKCAILLVDSDRGDHNEDGWSLLQLKQEAFQDKIKLCIQDPNLEGIFLKMLDKNSSKMTGKQALSQLCTVWSNYKKGTDAITLAKKLKLDDLYRVAKIDKNLEYFLSLIGFI